MGIVHHPRYLVYFEIARTEWMRHQGLPYRAVMESGTQLTVAETGVKHLLPARYEDELTIGVRCAESGGASVRLVYEVRRGGDLLATGFTRLGSTDTSGRPKRMPPELRARFDAAAAEDAAQPAVS